MPRSNKKKKPISQSVVPQDEQSAIAQLLNEEKILMISRAIVSISYFFVQILSYINIFRPVQSIMELM